jgi:transcriptional regulator with XRE-family HTH domain
MLDSELRKAFGSRLRALRKQHHWTLKEFAAKINLKSSQVNKYECGINLPPGEKLLEIADLLRISIDYLLAGNANDSIPLHNKRLLERFAVLESFSQADQEVVITLIDAMIVRHRVTSALIPIDQLPIPATSSQKTAVPASTAKAANSKAVPALSSKRSKSKFSKR